jgi:sugar fermentation stimulation protein A
MIEGIIRKRPNRFIMEVEIAGKIELAHCPVTGKIGSFDFKNTPCLLSKSNNPKRKTKFTVEAISAQRPEHKRKK